MLITEFDYGHVGIVNEFMTFANKQELSENSYYVFVSDTYIYSDKLYVLMLSLEGNWCLLSQRLVILEEINFRIVVKLWICK